MPKITELPWFSKAIKFPGEFTETYNKFLDIIKIDSKIQSKLTKVQKKCGYVSLGIREAIEEYVNNNYRIVLENSIKKKEEKLNKKKNITDNKDSNEKKEMSLMEELQNSEVIEEYG